MDRDDTATLDGAQDITSRIEEKLYPSKKNASSNTADDEGIKGGANLPDDDDSDSDDEDGSELDDVDTGDDEGSDDSESDSEASLADYLGVDEERIIVGDDGSVKLNAIIDGKPVAVDLKSLVASYQLQGHVNNKSMALENERKEFETARNDAALQLKDRLDNISSLSQVLEQQLLADYQSINWDTLRTTDPSEWTALRQEFADRAGKLQRAQALIQDNARKHNEMQQQESQVQMMRTLQAEREKMILDNPTWVDEAVLVRAQADIKTFLTSTYGFTEDDMRHVTDHRVVKMIQDAMAFRKGKVTAMKKKQTQVPQFKKPGVSKQVSANLMKARDVKAKKAAVRKTGHVRDVANLIESRM